MRQKSDKGWLGRSLAGRVAALIAACRRCACPAPHGVATATAEQPRRTTLGSRTFHCRACRRTCNERTGTAYSHLQYPTALVVRVVLRRLRYTRSSRDLAALFLERGFVCTREAVREWAARCAPPLAAQRRARRRGMAGTNWHADETDLRVDGRWRSRYRALDRDGTVK